MAWNNEEIHQKHQKVYNFMKRNLPQERYDGLRAVEPCVVISDEFNKAFKFVVLGEDAIFITENPPKHAKDIRVEISLPSVTELCWINDVPEFLSGEAKENAIHIMVCYNKSVCHITTPGSQNNSAYNLNKSTLTSSTSKVSTLSLPRSHSSGNVNQDVVQVGSCAPICGRPLPPPPKGFENKGAVGLSVSRERLVSTKDGLPSVRTEEMRKRGRRQPKSRSLASSGHSDDMDFSSVEALNLSSRSAELSVKKTSKYSKRLSSSASSAELSTQLGNTANYSKQNALQLPDSGAGGSRPLPKKNFGTRTAYDVAQAKMNETERAIVHLYVLTKDSNIFMHMRSSWNNCLLKSTLLGDDKQASLPRPSSRANKDSGQLLQLFSQLKSEILSSHQMEQSFCLVQEMCFACKRSSVIKKMFWKSSDLFMFLVNQLELFHHKSPRHGKHKTANRADELDYVVVLLETLAEMFRETEMLTSRLNVLKSNKCQAVAELLKAIVTPPQTQVKRRGREVSHGAKALLGELELMKETAKQEKEFQTLLPEITHHDIGLLFELVTAAHQANWFTTENTTLSVSWVVKILEVHQDIESFIKRLMDYMVSLVSSSESLLTREQAVSLYHQFTILKHCIDYSPKLSTHLCHQYSEEFRYYVRHQVLISKLPEEFPLTSPLVNLINNVMSHVLEMKTKKKSKNYLRD